MLRQVTLIISFTPILLGALVPVTSAPVRAQNLPLVAQSSTQFDFRNVSDYNKLLEKLIQDYQEGRLSRDEALRQIKAADQYATSKLDRPLYPLEGLRKKTTEIFGFVYEADNKQTNLNDPTKFKNLKEYGALLDEVTRRYEEGKITRDAARRFVETANQQATEELSTRFYPFRGQREKIAQRFGFIYELDAKDGKIREMADSSASWPARVTPEYWSDQGQKAVTEKNYKLGIQYYDLALQINSRSAKTYHSRGNAYYKLKAYKEAKDDYTRAIDIDSGFAEAYYNRGNTYSNPQLKDYEKAIEDYTKATEINPSYGKAYYNLGNVRYQLQDRCGALKDWQKAAVIFRDQDDTASYDVASRNIQSLSATGVSCPTKS